MKIGELFFDLGFKSDTTKLKDFVRNVGDLNMSSVLAAFGLDRVYESIKHIMEVGDKTALSINNFSKVTGQSADEFQKWSKFATQMGMDAGVIASDVAGLQDSITRMSVTGEGSNAWNLIGVDPRGIPDMFTIIEKIRVKIKDLPVNQQRFYLENLGLSTELLKIIDTTDNEWESIVTQMTNASDQLQKMREWHKQINKLSGDWATVLTDLAAIFAPLLEFIVEAAEGFVKILHWLTPILEIVVKIGAAVLYIVALFNPLYRVATVIATILTGIGLISDRWGIAGTPNTQGNSTTNTRTNHNQFNFHIQGSDSQDMAKQFNEHLTRALSNAEYQTPLPNN